MSKLEINGLTKNYGSLKALDNLSLSVYKGELLAILGPSGCGKSTLLAAIAGIEDLDHGRITLDGECIFDSSSGCIMPPEKRNIGFVFQSYALWPHMNVGKNLAYPLRIRKAPRAFIELEIERILSLLRLESKRNSYPGQLSGGEQQRVALGRALIMNPRLLLLDEPLSNLDARLREEMQVEIRQIQQKLGLTVVHVTHDQSEAMAMSDRIVVMNYGKLVQTGKPQEIYENPGTIFTADFIGINNLIYGKIIKIKESLFFDSGKGIKFKLSEPDMEKNNAAVIAIRPEDVLTDQKNSFGETLAGTGKITSHIYKGAHILYGINTGETIIKAQEHSHNRYNTGDKIFFSFRRITLIPR